MPPLAPNRVKAKGAVINKPTDRPGGIFNFFKYVSCPNKTGQKRVVPQQNFPKMCSTPTHTGQFFWGFFFVFKKSLHVAPDE